MNQENIYSKKSLTIEKPDEIKKNIYGRKSIMIEKS
jgi:hypothetical protein